VARLLASLPGYVYTTSDEGLWVHLYATGTATAPLPSVGAVTVRQRTDYPWDGRVALEVDPASPAPFSLFLRIPSWTEGATVEVNGVPVPGPVEPGSYLEVRRRWQSGDTVNVALPMDVRLMESHALVANNRGRVAITRGPLVYCVEAADHAGADVWDLALPRSPRWRTVWEPELLGGVVALRTQAHASDSATGTALYRPHRVGAPRAACAPTELMAIPYYAWANRAPGPMQVWIPLDSDPASSF